MAFTVFWYGKKGLLDKTQFDDERTAKSHAIDTFAARKRDFGVVAVEVRKDVNGTVVFSRAG
jgi:hypothetical protein